MKVLLAAHGTRGDVEPLAAVGRELLRRGHDVCMTVPPHMCGLVESAGLEVVAWVSTPWQGDGDFANGQIPPGAMIEMMTHVAREWAEWVTTLATLAKGADLLLANKGRQERAAIVAEYYDIPLAVLRFFPGEPSRAVGGMLGNLIKDAEDAQRRALGLPEATGSFESLEIHAYDGLCFPEAVTEWAKQGGRWPFVGALTLELPTDADDEVLSWIAAGTPPIYFGFGSMSVESPAYVIATISAACAQLGERALVCAGWSDFSGVPHFEHVKVVGAVNHAAIFPACRAVVHHGGAGTTAAGLRAGVPTLILWFGIQDQRMWAAAVERLGVGSGRDFLATTAASLVADLRSILTPQYMSRAREVAAQMTTHAQSVASAADLLEEAVRQIAPADR
jgi:UDP:flavonoid glycosyltransferase YjiC (YdhE family)